MLPCHHQRVTCGTSSDLHQVKWEVDNSPPNLTEYSLQKMSQLTTGKETHNVGGNTLPAHWATLSLASHSQKVSNEGTLRVSLPFSPFSLGSFHVLFFPWCLSQVSWKGLVLNRQIKATLKVRWICVHTELLSLLPWGFYSQWEVFLQWTNAAFRRDGGVQEKYSSAVSQQFHRQREISQGYKVGKLPLMVLWTSLSIAWGRRCLIRREPHVSLHQEAKPTSSFARRRQDMGVSSFFRSSSELLDTLKHTEDWELGSNSTLEKD